MDLVPQNKYECTRSHVYTLTHTHTHTHTHTNTNTNTNTNTTHTYTHILYTKHMPTEAHATYLMHAHHAIPRSWCWPGASSYLDVTNAVVTHKLCTCNAHATQSTCHTPYRTHTTHSLAVGAGQVLRLTWMLRMPWYAIGGPTNFSWISTRAPRSTCTSGTT